LHALASPEPKGSFPMPAFLKSLFGQVMCALVLGVIVGREA
jgi:hypothetical protein